MAARAAPPAAPSVLGAGSVAPAEARRSVPLSALLPHARLEATAAKRAPSGPCEPFHGPADGRACERPMSFRYSVRLECQPCVSVLDDGSTSVEGSGWDGICVVVVVVVGIAEDLMPSERELVLAVVAEVLATLWCRMQRGCSVRCRPRSARLWVDREARKLNTPEGRREIFSPAGN